MRGAGVARSDIPFTRDAFPPRMRAPHPTVAQCALLVVWSALAATAFFKLGSCAYAWGGTGPSDWFRWGGPEP